MRKVQTVIFALAITGLLFYGCSKEDPQDNQNDGDVLQLQGISDDTRNGIPIDGGEIGLEIDARNLAILGYEPGSADIIIEGALNAYSKENIPVDEYTHVASLIIPVEGLEEDVLTKFKEGVPIQVIIYDSNGNELESQSVSKFIFNGPNKTLEIQSEKAKILKPLTLNPSTPYYVAIGTESDTTVLGGSLDYREGSPLEYWESGPVQLNAFNLSDEPEGKIQLLYFAEQQDGTYLIKTAFEDSYLEVNELGTLYWNKANRDDNTEFYGIEDKHRFIVDQTEEGKVKIRPYTSDSYLKVNPNFGIITTDFDVSNSPDPESYDLTFTVLAANITWELESLGTKYSAPIIPPTEMDFAFDQTIINCSSSTGTYEVGTDTEETKTTTISFEEGISLASSRTSSRSATVEAEASGKVFGVGVSVTASATFSSSATRGFGKSASEEKVHTTVETKSVSTRRSIEVGPYTSIEVFDVIQRINNIKIPFAQRFLLRGSDGDVALSGSEIATQLGANRFGGVITEIGSDYILFSIRGSVNVDNFFDFRNTIDDIVGACD